MTGENDYEILIKEDLYRANTCHNGNLMIPEENRHNEAIKYVQNTLWLAGVGWTPEVEALAEGAIQACVNALGHSSVNIAAANATMQ